MNYSLVALDIDGTLINTDRQITPRTKKAIQEFRERGGEVTLCTGRMLAASKSFAQELELTVPIITYNGGLIAKYPEEEIIYQALLARNFAEQIIQGARKQGFAIQYYHDDRLLVEKITEGSTRYAEYSGVALEKVDDLLELPFNPLKILLIGEEEKLQDFEQNYRDEFKEEVYITRSWPIFLEFLNPAANKGRGLQELAKILAIEKEKIVGIGDNYNDLAMFQYAGLKVAMGNGEEALKQEADFITATNEEDGVALVLEGIMNKQDFF